MPIIPALKIDVRDEGASQGRVGALDFAGAGVSAAVSGDVATITIAGGAGSPGGSNTQIQFNDASAFGGDAGLTYNKTTDALTVAGSVTISGLTAGRIPYVSTAGLIADDSALTWDATNNLLSITPSGAFPGSDPLAVGLERTITTPPPAAPGAVNPLMGVYGTFAQSGAVNQGRIGIFSSVGDDATVVNKSITNAVSSGGPDLIRITATGHGFATGDRINIYGVGGTTEANGVWTITVIDANTFDLDSSTHTNAYTSGGTATNRGLYYAGTFNVRPALDRDGVTLTGTGANGDDVAAITISNDGAGKATDAIWITDATISGGSKAAFNSILASDSDVDTFISYFGKIYSAGIDFGSATLAVGTEPIIRFGNGHNIELGTGSGTKIGTATSQKLGFFNATPIVQNTSTTDLRTGLINLGFFASGGASPLDLNGGAFTAGSATVAGNFTVDTNTLFVDAAANRIGMGTTSPQVFLDANGGTTSITASFDSYANPSNLRLRRANGDSGATTRAASADNLGSVTWWGAAKDDTGSGATFANATAILRAIAKEAFTTTARGSHFEILTTPTGSTTSAVRALLDDKGLTLGAALAARATTNPTNALTLVDGTAPVGTLTNAVQLYSASGELLAMDSGGNVANLTLPFTSTVPGVVPASGGTSTHKFLTQNVTFASPVYCKSITIESPTSAEDVSVFWTDEAITITKMVAVCVGTSPSVTWTIRHGTDRSAAGTEVVTGGTVTTSTTTGSVVTAFNDATVVADAFLWLETTAQSGTVTSLHVSICYTVD